ncbi:creatininase family protein [Halosimplex litoreum]|uniref:Creatininase family protein n=1 Tax=Halosimplex litoreum TaxID=1198301 RepID=A0A7T3FVX1_9EURY|nr:creatininase family protein [Halosimplex litoreum]QPV61705.1 creatininase family protein [Halosimplex litoreum]
MHLSTSTWSEADAVETGLAVLPVGSTEQHGPHAPLGTDALTAETVAEAGVEAYDGEVVVAPTVPVGVAEEHRQFAGTLWVSEDTFRDYVRETVASLAHHGWDRVVVVNGHGGNVAALREVCGRIARHDDAYAAAFTWFDAVDLDRDWTGDPDAPPVDLDAVRMGHGGPVETALVRAVAPDLIREDRVDDAAAGAADGWGEWVSGTNLAYDSAEFSENGTVGDPRDGSEALGEWLRERAAERLSTLLDELATRDVSRPERR